MSSNPYADPKVKAGISERISDFAVESLRRNVKKVIDGYGLSFECAIAFMATLQPSLEVAALSRITGEDYLEKVTRWCMEEVNKTIPKTVGEGEPRIVGNGKHKRIDTGVIKMPEHKYPQESQTLFDDAPVGPKQPTTVLGNPIPPNPPKVEITDDIRTAMKNIKAAAHEPDMSDVTAHHTDSKSALNDDELTGKSDVIEGEVIEDKPKTEPQPQPVADPPMEAADMLREAFPYESSDYRMRFFRETTGYKLLADGVAEIGWPALKEKLAAGIAAAKAPKVEQSEQPKPSAEPPAEKPPVSEQLQSSPSSSLPAVISKSEVAPLKNSIGFRIPTPEQFSYMQQLAKFVADSGFYKEINTPAKAMVIFMKGYAVNVEPMTALDGIFMVNGKPYVGAKLAKALVEASGLCQRFDIFGDDKQCTVTVQRKGREKPNVYQFTWQDAIKAKLTGNNTYEKYPAQMLRWRAVRQAVETDFPELGFGLGGERDDEDEAA